MRSATEREAGQEEEACAQDVPQDSMSGKGEVATLAGLTLGRACVAAAASFAMTHSPQLLLNAFNGDSARAQKFMAMIGSINTATSLALSGIAGGLIDSYGRKFFLVLAPAASAVLRLLVSRWPTPYSYATYRICLSIVWIPFYDAFRAAVADSVPGGRTGEKYAGTMQSIDNVATVVRMVSLSLTYFRSSGARRGMQMSAFLSALAGLGFAMGTRETLKERERKPFVWKRAANPLHALNFFFGSRDRNPKLARMGALLFLLSLPNYNSTLSLYRRSRFGWTSRHESLQTMLCNLAYLGAPWVIGPMTRRFGLLGTVQIGEVLSMLCWLNNALTREPRSMHLNTLTCMFDHEHVALDRQLALECQTSSGSLGQGEMSAAKSNLSSLAGLFMPSMFSQLFAATINSEKYQAVTPLLGALLHGINATIVAPALWPSALTAR